MAENPTPTPGEYVRDVGSGEQLGMGDATDANAELAAGDAVEEQLADQQLVDPAMAADIPEVQFDTSEERPYRPADDDEEFLLMPPDGGPTMPPKGASPVPQSVIRSLPLLSAAVADPTTPPAIKAAYRLILQRLAAEQEANY